MAKRPGTPVLDQGWRAYGAHLLTTEAPYDPHTRAGDSDDPAVYIGRPGLDFLRPWLAIRGGEAFQWPLGLQAFTLTTDPVLGRHTFIGDNKIVVDVIHTGEETLNLSGSFPGNSAPALVRALRDVVRKDAGEEGKILYLPEVLKYAQRVQVAHSEFSRTAEDGGRDVSYSIDFQIIGLDRVDAKVQTFSIDQVQTSASPKGLSARKVTTDSKHNTLRKIALWKFNDVSKWTLFFNANEYLFTAIKVPKSSAPDYRLAIGTVLTY